MTLFVPTFSSDCLQATNFWEHNFSLNLFSRNILWRFYPKTGNLIQQEFLIVKIFTKKPIVTMKL